jgi:hypothetical protein
MRFTNYILVSIVLLALVGCAKPTPQPAAPQVPVVQPTPAAAPTEPGVHRVFDKTEVAPGDTLTEKIFVNLAAGQTYYLFDEAVPEGFNITGEHDGKNHIKQIEIQDATSKVFEYKLTAPSTPGTFTFSGEYGVEGTDLASIKGISAITVK